MLTLVLEASELFDETTNTFTNVPEVSIDLEHSLFAVSKWEASFEKPFLSETEKTIGETAAYINCMAISPIDEGILNRLTPSHFRQVNVYIGSKQTATWFSEDSKPGRRRPPREVITAEIMYYWMVAAQIPWEAQHWHLNRLMTLVRVIDAKNQKPKKMSRKDAMAQHRAANLARREQRAARANDG